MFENMIVFNIIMIVLSICLAVMFFILSIDNTIYLICMCLWIATGILNILILIDELGH